MTHHTPKLVFTPASSGKFVVSIEVEPGKWADILGVTERTQVAEIFSRAFHTNRANLRDSPLELVRPDPDDDY